MELTYSLSNDDYITHQLYIASTSPSIKKKIKRARFIVPIFYLAYGTYISVNDEGYTGIILFTLLSLIWIFFYPKYANWRYKKHYKNHIKNNYQNRINQPINVKITKDEILGFEDGNETKIQIANATKLIELRNQFHIKLKTDVSLIIPKNKIKNKEEFIGLITNKGVEYVNENDWKFKL